MAVEVDTRVPARTRMRDFAANFKGANSILEQEAADHFADDTEVIDWALGFAAIFMRADYESARRRRVTRKMRSADLTGRKLDLLEQFFITNGVEYGTILDSNKPEILAHTAEKRHELDGEYDQLRVMERIAFALPNNTITPREYFSKRGGEKKLADIFAATNGGIR